MQHERIIVTEHGEKRCRERLGLPRRAVRRTVEKVWALGGVVRSLKDYPVETGSAVRAWGGFVFVFKEHGDEVRLLTVIENRMKARGARRRAGAGGVRRDARRSECGAAQAQQEVSRQ